MFLAVRRVTGVQILPSCNCKTVPKVRKVYDEKTVEMCLYDVCMLRLTDINTSVDLVFISRKFQLRRLHNVGGMDKIVNYKRCELKRP